MSSISGLGGSSLRAGGAPRVAARRATAEVLPIILTAGLIIAAGLATLRLAGIDFVRAIAPQLYGVAPDHVIGSSLKKTFVVGESELRREPNIASINDKDQKAINIDLHGRFEEFVDQDGPTAGHLQR